MNSDNLKKSFFLRLSLKESWIIFFILGIIMLNYPFLHMFNKPATLMNMPLLYHYFTEGWCISIIVIYLFTRTIETENNRQNGSPHP
jgi:hypothetical protein